MSEAHNKSPEQIDTESVNAKATIVANGLKKSDLSFEAVKKGISSFFGKEEKIPTPEELEAKAKFDRQWEEAKAAVKNKTVLNGEEKPKQEDIKPQNNTKIVNDNRAVKILMKDQATLNAFNPNIRFAKQSGNNGEPNIL